jgi:hypothetical protein
VPGNWNGSLVVWAHGFRGTGLELTVDNHPLRALLISRGFAWAASSYSRNDYDITSGVQTTHALVQRFNGLVGRPSRVYMTGASLGGHVTAVSIEQYPHAYDAALPICGVVGDYELFDYFLDFNVAAQQLGTGSSQFPVNPVEYITSTVPQIKANLSLVPGGWPNVLNAAGQNLKNLTELRSGGERPNFDEAWFFWNTFPVFASGPGTSSSTSARETAPCRAPPAWASTTATSSTSSTAIRTSRRRSRRSTTGWCGSPPIPRARKVGWRRFRGSPGTSASRC